MERGSLFLDRGKGSTKKIEFGKSSTSSNAGLSENSSIVGLRRLKKMANADKTKNVKDFEDCEISISNLSGSPTNANHLKALDNNIEA